MPARRVLVPLAVVALAAALYFWNGGSGAPTYDVADDVAQCAANLRQIYRGLVLYSVKAHQPPPQESGVRFLALLAGEVLEGEPANRARLTTSS